MAPNIPPNTGRVPTNLSSMPRKIRVPNSPDSRGVGGGGGTPPPTQGQLYPRGKD